MPATEHRFATGFAAHIFQAVGSPDRFSLKNFSELKNYFPTFPSFPLFSSVFVQQGRRQLFLRRQNIRSRRHFGNVRCHIRSHVSNRPIDSARQHFLENRVRPDIFTMSH